jgi:hypothetical protein
MKRTLLLAAAWTCLAASVSAQEPVYQEELNFVQRLRAGDYKDLAEQYLQRLEKTASPELKAELPLELAKTRLAKAADEPDANRRMSLFLQAKSDLKKFVDANPTHARIGEAKLDLANVSVREGKAKLSRALADSASAAVATPDLLAARKLFEDAAKDLVPVAGELQKLLDTYKNASSPADKLRKARLERDVLQAQYDIALNIYDQAQTYPKRSPHDDDLKGRNARVLKAKELFEKLAKTDEGQPVLWLSIVWLARCDEELGKPKAAREKYADIRERGARFPASGEAVRMARYFDMLTVSELGLEDKKEDPLKYVEKQARAWITAYPRHLSTSEGYGVRFLLAEILLVKTEKPKPEELLQGRNLIREIEQTENDYTDRARTLKIQLIAKQGGFSKPITDLKSFEDCYVRAQYEIDQSVKATEEMQKAKAELAALQGGKDEAKIKAKEKEIQTAEKKRQTAQDNIVAALSRALESDEAKTKTSREIANAKAMMTWFYLDAKKYSDAVRVGRAFVDKDPSSPQAALAASYVLDAYAQIVGQRQRAEPPASAEEMAKARKDLIDWAKLVEQRWARDSAGDGARFQLALLHLAEKRLPECIDCLERVTPAYFEYARSQFLLYETATRAEKEGVKPPNGDDPKLWQQRGLDALKRIPDVTGTSPMNNYLYMMSRLVLAQDLFRNQKFAEGESAAKVLSDKLKSVPPLRFNEDEDQNSKLHDFLANNAADLRLRGLAAHVRDDFEKNQHDKVATVLNVLVKEINDGKWPEMKANMHLGGPLLNMALKSDLLSGQLPQAREALKAMKSLADDSAGDKTADTLKMLAVLSKQLLDDIRSKDPSSVNKTTAGLQDLLGDAIKDKKDLNSEALLALSQVYSALDQYGKASDELAKIKAPKDDAPDVEKGIYRAARILYVRQLRMLRELDKAEAAMVEIMGKPGDKTPGWGRRSVEARKEYIQVLEARDKWMAAAAEANSLVAALAKDYESDPRKKEDYFECNYHVVLGLLRDAQRNHKKGEAKYDKDIKDAARFIHNLEVRVKGFGPESSERRFKELLASEPELKTEYEKMKR